jgi:RNA 3'-terminal phosphate cyclase (GTP)
MDRPVVTIDGSYGEGGGAILRQALGCAVLAGRPVRIVRIRAGRREPGLRPQHLKAIEAARLLCGAEVDGAEPGSLEVTFVPGPARSGAWTLDVGTAGATTLVLQAVLLPGLCTPGPYRFACTGGTDVPWSPPADYLARVTAAALAGFGTLRVECRRRGYYPKGGGRLDVEMAGGSGPWPRIEWTEPAVVRAVRGLSHAATALRERRVAERQARAAERELAPLGVEVRIEVEYADAACPGSALTLWTEGSRPPLGAAALGARGLAAEEVGRRAARALRAEIEAGAAVDRHLADQVVPFLAVAGGRIRTSAITGHTRSNVYVAGTLLGATFRVDEERGFVEAEPGR